MTKAEIETEAAQALWSRQGLLRNGLNSHFQSQLESLSQAAQEAKDQKAKENMQDAEKRAQMSILMGAMEREREKEKARDVEKDRARQNERETEETAASRMRVKMGEVEETRKRLQLR